MDQYQARDFGKSTGTVTQKESSNNHTVSKRQDPQGEEKFDLPVTPSSSKHFSYSSTGTPLSSHQTHKPITKSNYQSTLTHMTNMSDNNSQNVSSQVPHSELNSGSSDVPNLTSALPDNFSDLSSASQQALLQRILASHPLMQSNVHNSRSFLMTEHSQDSGICDFLTTPYSIGERGAGVGAVATSMSNVVSLPNHSSSLNLPESSSQTASSKNDCNASMCSSNNTLVIHGSSPDSPFKYNSSNQQQYHNRYANLSNPERLSPENTPAPLIVKQPPPSYNSSQMKSYPAVPNSALSPAEKVLNYISGNCSDLSDVPSSIIEQSEVLKHLLMNNTNLSVPNSNSTLSFNKNNVTNVCSSIEDNSITSVSYSQSILHGASAKLTSKSSSSGSVYSNPLDNLTSTSGYSSSQASTPYTRRSATFNNASTSNYNNSNQLNEDSRPPPAYPQWLIDKDNAPITSDNEDRGRNRANKDTRRDLSLGPEFSREKVIDNNSNAYHQNKSQQSSLDKSPLSQSQPDLSKFSSNLQGNQNSNLKNLTLSQRLSIEEMPKFLDLLYNENIALKQKVNNYTSKISKLQKLEAEIQKITTDNDNLLQSYARREHLEKLARTKLQNQLQIVTKSNLELKQEVNILRNMDPSNISSRLGADERVRIEVSKRDAIITQLVLQNRELIASKEKLDMEVLTQKQTISGQRKHLDLLNSALTAAQNSSDEHLKQQTTSNDFQQRLQQADQLDAQRKMHREMVILRYKQLAGNVDVSNAPTDAIEMELMKLERQRSFHRAPQTAGENSRSLTSQLPHASQGLRTDDEIGRRNSISPSLVMQDFNKQRSPVNFEEVYNRTFRKSPTDTVLCVTESSDDDVTVPTVTSSRSQCLSLPISLLVDAKRSSRSTSEVSEDTICNEETSRENNAETVSHLKPRYSYYSSHSSSDSDFNRNQMDASVTNISSRFANANDPRTNRLALLDDYQKNVLSNYEQMNYSTYITQQFNKLRDVTLSQSPDSKRASLPYKTDARNQHFLDLKSEDLYQNKSAMKYPSRPHSCISFPTADYLNRENGASSEKERVAILPKYVEPPQYEYQEQRRANLFEHSNHEGSAPPVIMRDGTEVIDRRPFSYHEKNKYSTLSHHNYDFFYSNTPVDVQRYSLPPQKPNPPEVFVSPPRASTLSLKRYSTSPSPRLSRELEEEQRRGDPPPYHSHHAVLSNSRSEHQPLTPSDSLTVVNEVPGVNNNLSDVGMPLATPVDICRKNHPSTVTCKTCNNARSTYRKNAANLVRRASSGASLLKRKSAAKIRSSFHTEIDLEETPSILARLRKEWQDRKGGSKSTGSISSPEKKSADSDRLSSQSKSSEIVGYNISNLSQEQWTIKENQTMTYTSDKMPIFTKNMQKSTPVLSSEDALVMGNCAIREMSEGECESESAKYTEGDVSDNDTTYDTLIIKDLSDLSESQSTDGSSSHDDLKQYHQRN